MSADRSAIVAWMQTPLAGARRGLGAVDDDYNDDDFDYGSEAEFEDKPPLKEAWAVYRGFFMPDHGERIEAFEEAGVSEKVARVSDFVEVLRDIGKSHLYDDNDWIMFFYYDAKVVKDYDAARDLWDAALSAWGMTMKTTTPPGDDTKTTPPPASIAPADLCTRCKRGMALVRNPNGERVCTTCYRGP